MSEINNVENKASVINVSAPLDYEAIKREWEEIDKLEASLPAEVKRNRKLGMKARKTIGLTATHIILIVLSIIWLVTLAYLVVQSFRAEPGAWSDTFFPKTYNI